MGKPPTKKSQHGRANPQGIPYLYLASNHETAIAEIRPAIHDKITVGKFQINTNIEVIDLRNPGIKSPFAHGYELEYIIQHLNFLRKLGSEISKPINPEDSDLDYIPLQYLCEFIKHRGYDGVIYKSSVGTGYNIAIFNDNKISCVSTKLYELDFSPRAIKPNRQK
jgi:biotin carboxylase